MSPKCNRQVRRGGGPTGGRRRRGTALVETALCIPILAAIIGSTLFLGFAMMNQQHVKAAARYTPWRRVYGNWYRPPGLDPNDPNAQDDPNYPGLNYLFFRSRAAGIHVDGVGGSREEFDGLVAAAGQHGQDAEQLAHDLIFWTGPDDSDGFDHSRGARVWANFPSDVAVLEQFRGAIRASHIRDGVEWRRSQARCRRVVREQFLHDVDNMLQSVGGQGEGMAQMIMGLYRRGGGW